MSISIPMCIDFFKKNVNFAKVRPVLKLNQICAYFLHKEHIKYVQQTGQLLRYRIKHIQIVLGFKLF